MAICRSCKGETSKVRTCNHEGIRIAGIVYQRDSEHYDTGKRCHDCGIVNKAGNFHHFSCDVERCPKCGGQLISCDCGVEGVVLLGPAEKGVNYEARTPKIEQPQHTKAEEEAYERAKQADYDTRAAEAEADAEAAAEILYQVGQAAEAEDLLSTEEREERDKAVLDDIVDRQGVDGVASMLRDICHTKAEHLRSNSQDKTSAVILEQCAEELDSFVGWYYGLGD